MAHICIKTAGCACSYVWHAHITGFVTASSTVLKFHTSYFYVEIVYINLIFVQGLVINGTVGTWRQAKSNRHTNTKGSASLLSFTTKLHGDRLVYYSSCCKTS